MPRYLFGVINDQGAHYDDEWSRGVRATTLELQWKRYEPQEGVYDLAYINHLKDILRQLKDKTRRRFNVSIAEVGKNDVVNRAEIGITVVGNERRHVNSTLDTVNHFIEELYLAEIVDCELELLNY